MKDKLINSVNLNGYLYEHNLVIKQVQNKDSANFGKDFISGSISLATDEDCLNIVTVHYTYVAPTYGSGAVNNSFTALKQIIETGKTVLTDGKEAATKLRLSPSIDLNDFYDRENKLVSAKRCEGGFVTILSTLPENRNRFDADMYINGIKLVEADPERNIEADYLIVKGAIFNFRKDIKPIEFIVKNPGGIKYFESLDASPANPTFTKVWGEIISKTIVTTREEESAFGEPTVRKIEKTTREWVITGTNTPDKIYEMGTDLTKEEVATAMSNREVYLAEVKKRSDDYRNTQSGGNVTSGVTAGAFNF